MRFDLELSGVDVSGRKVTLRTTVYASSQRALQAEAEKAAAAGPWFDEAGNELPPGGAITVERVRPLDKRQ